MTPPLVIAERRLRVFGVDAHLVVCGSDADLLRWALDSAAARAFDLERLWLADFGALNQAPGRPVKLAAESIALVAEAVDAYWQTGGRFDPTAVDELAAPDMAIIGERKGIRSRRASAVGQGHGCGQIEIDAVGGTVTLPAEVQFDPFSVGRALAADWLCAGLLVAGVAGACVNIGGDLRLEGEAAHHGGWRIGVDLRLDGDADHAPPLVAFDRAGGGVASAADVRVIDARTGRPCRTDVRSVTIAASTAVRARVLATTTVMAGVMAGLGLVVDADAAALVVDADGHQHHVGVLGRIS